MNARSGARRRTKSVLPSTSRAARTAPSTPYAVAVFGLQLGLPMAARTYGH